MISSIRQYWTNPGRTKLGIPLLAIACLWSPLSANAQTPTPTSGSPPTISAVPVLRTAGAGVSNSPIANVSDANDPPNTLTVTVNGGASATQNGVTVNNLSINVAGVVTVDVDAAVGASDASFTFAVTNSGTASATSTLPIIVLSSCPGSGTWLQQAKNTASDGAEFDFFGSSVAIGGETAIVGAYRNNAAGSAYVFTRSGTVWTQQQKLTASDGAADDNFGSSVAISGDTVVVGAFGDDSARGSAYVFTRSGGVWTQQQKVTASDGAEGDNFGWSVTISGDTAIIGAPYDDTVADAEAGSAYVFTRSGTVWTQQQKLTASDGAASDKFGQSVTISGDTAIVAAPYDETAAGTEAGSAYVFTRSGTVWTQQQKLTASDGAEYDRFGYSVAISGDTVIVGSFYDDTTAGIDAGSVYVFTSSGTVWTQQQKLTASDAVGGDQFGWSVTISGDTAIVGAPNDETAAGSVYVFTRGGNVWTQQEKLTASDAASIDSFGLSVALGGDTAIVGAPFHDTAAGGQYAGSSYIFDKTCPATTPTPTPPSTPTPTPPSVSISGTVLYCSNPVPGPVPNVTLTLTGTMGGSTASDGSGNYTFSSLPSGGSYTVTPSKAALPPGNGNITTVDVIAVQKQFLTGTFLSGCKQAAADVTGDTFVTTQDVIAVQRFFNGFTNGIANTGKYQFTPVNRTYPGIGSDQTGQNYDTLVFGDVAPGFVERVSGLPQTAAGDSNSAGKVPVTVAAVALPEVAVDQSKSNFIAAVKTSAVDPKNKLVGFQGDFTFDERAVTFQSEPVQKAGLTSGNWNVSGNVLTGAGPLRTLRISAFSNDFTPLEGSGTLFELRMTRVSKATQGTQLIWAAPPDHFIFIDADLNTQKPDFAASGGLTSSTSPAGWGR